ncbi:MAG: adenylate/guanylate cyclase domain-containing protein [Actinomycetes bacterium]
MTSEPGPAPPPEWKPVDTRRRRSETHQLRSREVSREAGVSLLSARKFWRALGFPNVPETAEAFSEADVHALHEISGLVREGLVDEATALGLTRAVGRSVDRLASWQLQLIAEVIAEHHECGEEEPKQGQQMDVAEPGAGNAGAERDPGLAQGLEVADALKLLADRLEPLVVYAWRRHLAAHVQRYVVEHAPDPTQTVPRSVGFADLVSFTRMVRRLTERELAQLVQRFEATASDIVASHGGRVVKTVGDEVLFVAERVSSAAGIALDVAAEMSEDEMLPEVRVGVATGPVLARLGDVYGTTVNRASRLTAIASPGTVLVDDATAAVVNELSGFAVRPLPARSLRGIGEVSPWLLSRRAARRTERDAWAASEAEPGG